MRTNAFFFLTLANVFTISCFAQQVPNLNSDNQVAVVAYHVEERVNMNFGSSVTTYNVPSLNLVSTNNLGGNNTRVVTPKYAKIRPKTIAIDATKKTETKALATVAATKPVTKDSAVATERKTEYVNIDVVSTYERVMDKGYKSVLMLTKVADRHYFDGDLVLAAKWYTELFNSTTALEAVYYYRYGQSLIATGQKEKGNEMMKIFESKSL